MKTSRQHTVYPICLLLEDQPCLVVGGGRVAARKVAGLLMAKAEVTVISPEFSDAFSIIKPGRKLKLVTRKFQADGMTRFKLVFAATDDPQVNQEIIRLCRQQHVLCCAADANWEDGDFVTPSIYRSAAATIAVSTGGQSCTNAIKIRDMLARTLQESEFA